MPHRSIRQDGATGVIPDFALSASFVAAALRLVRQRTHLRDHRFGRKLGEVLARIQTPVSSPRGLTEWRIPSVIPGAMEARFTLNQERFRCNISSFQAYYSDVNLST